MPIRSSLSYCGIDCGACFIRNSKIADQAQRLLAGFRKVRFEQWAKKLAKLNPRELSAFAKQEACYQVLQAWDAMRCGQTCRSGGGSKRCAIRHCCRKKKLAGCWLCGQSETCPTLGAVLAINGDLNLPKIRQRKP